MSRRGRKLPWNPTPQCWLEVANVRRVTVGGWLRWVVFYGEYQWSKHYTRRAALRELWKLYVIVWRNAHESVSEFDCCDDGYADEDEQHEPGRCDCCGTSMIDDTEIGCGTCYPCQAEIARLSEEAPDEP